MHELGHAFAARRQGIEVKSIQLFLFGGLTQMGRDTRSPGEEFKVSAAGPLATLGMVLVFLIVDLAIVGPNRLWHAFLLDGEVPVTPVLLALSWLLLMNVAVLVFNLVPAFPLDGGRIARAIVWRITGDKRRGTRTAAQLGQGFAVILAGLGIYLTLSGGRALSGIWLILLAFLLGQSARGRIGADRPHRADRGSARSRHHGSPAGGDSRPRRRSTRRWTSTSCATAGHGSR